VLGPAVFITTWVVLGARTAGYSARREPVSRLAGVDASTRRAMTAGFLAFSAGVGLYATELRRSMPGAAVAAATTAVATVGIAATPVGGPRGQRPHAATAVVAYLSLAATPLLGGRALARSGRPTAAALSRVVGLISGASLLTHMFVHRARGLTQRLGLTVGHTWIMASALGLLRE
jgi:hypothetical protein